MDVTGRFLLPGTGERAKRLYLAVQVVSTNLIILSAFASLFSVPEQVYLVFIVNSYIFFLLLLGMNIVLLLKKDGEMALEMFIALSVCFGTLAMYGAGSTLHAVGGTFVSEVVLIAIGIFNLGMSHHVFARGYRLVITTDDDTRPLLLIFLAITVLKFSLISESPLILDDQELLNNAFRFCRNEGSEFSGWLIPYFGREIEFPYEHAYSTSIGIVMKAGWPGSIPASTLLAKAYVATLGSFAMFPTNAYLARLIPARKVRYMFLIIMVGNQWQFIDGAYILTVVPFTLYFTMSLYYFVRFLENDGPPAENLMLAVLVGFVAAGTRYNGLVPFVMQSVLVGFVYAIHKIRASNALSDTALARWLGHLDAPKVSRGLLIVCIQVLLYLAVHVPFQVAYQQRNGITVLDFALHYKYGYCDAGNINQFTPVDGLSLPWLWERLAFSIPWYALNLTQLVGFIHVPTQDHALRVAINYPISIALFFAIGGAMVFYWLRLYKRKPLSFTFQLPVFLLMFASMVLWGEVFFVFYRWSYSIYILIIPPVYEGVRAIGNAISTRCKARVPADTVAVVLLVPLLAITLYGTIGFLIPFFSRDISVIQAYVKWQFAGIT